MLTNTQIIYTVTLLLFNYLIVYFKSYLCSIGRIRNASDADISVIFSQFFSFVYRHSDLEVSCSNGTKTRHGESRCC
jgi:hypothetical protein